MPMPLTPQQRTMRARLAAHKRWSQEDPQANAARGQAGLLDRFRREIIAEHGEGDRRIRQTESVWVLDPGSPFGNGHWEIVEEFDVGPAPA